MADALSLTQLSDVVERVVRHRYDAAVADVAEILRESPSASAAEVSNVLIKRAQRQLAAVAAVSGAAAAAPGIGTATAMATMGVDAAWTLTRLAEMVMGIGIAHGYDADSLEERKTWVLAALAMANGANGSLEEIARKLGTRGQIQLLRKMGPKRLESFNSTLAAKLATKLVTREGALRAGRLLPFGIGAGVGAVGNTLITRSVGKAAVKLFSQSTPPQRHRHLDVLDLDGEEVIL